jgi:intracellular multiplication protein IcmO
VLSSFFLELKIMQFEAAPPSSNRFATGNAGAVRDMLVGQLGDQMSSDSNAVFRERAMALISAVVPALVWMRDNKGTSLDSDVIRFSFNLRWIRKLATTGVCTTRDPQTGIETDIPVGDELPGEILWPLKVYLGELPDYDPTGPLDDTKGEAAKQHSFATMYVTAITQA